MKENYFRNFQVMEECGGLTYFVVQVTQLSTAIKEAFMPFYVIS